jgi:hypothetical protein
MVDRVFDVSLVHLIVTAVALVNVKKQAPGFINADS